jgi:hypothetical protein
MFLRGICEFGEQRRQKSTGHSFGHGKKSKPTGSGNVCIMWFGGRANRSNEKLDENFGRNLASFMTDQTKETLAPLLLGIDLTRSYSKNPSEMTLKEVSKIVLEEPLNFSRDHINSNKKDLPPRDILPKVTHMHIG